MAGNTIEVFEYRWTIWDLLLGILTVVAGGFILGHVALASLISILFVGWMSLFAGGALAVAGIIGWKEPARRWSLATGAILFILGIQLVRNPGAGLLVLTLVAGSLLLAGGIVRIVAAFQPEAPRGVLLTNGIITLLLGILVVSQWPMSALWLLGTILGVQLVIDGITTALIGRLRHTRTHSGSGEVPA